MNCAEDQPEVPEDNKIKIEIQDITDTVNPVSLDT